MFSFLQELCKHCMFHVLKNFIKIHEEIHFPKSGMIHLSTTFLINIVCLFHLFSFFLSKEKNIDYTVSIRRPVQSEITKGLLEQFVSEPILN